MSTKSALMLIARNFTNTSCQTSSFPPGSHTKHGYIKLAAVYLTSNHVGINAAISTHLKKMILLTIQFRNKLRNKKFNNLKASIT